MQKIAERAKLDEDAVGAVRPGNLPIPKTEKGRWRLASRESRRTVTRRATCAIKIGRDTTARHTKGQHRWHHRSFLKKVASAIVMTCRVKAVGGRGGKLGWR